MKTSSSVPRPDDPRDRFDLLDSAILTVVGIFGVSICLAYGSRAVVRWGFKKITDPIAKKFSPDNWF